MCVIRTHARADGREQRVSRSLARSRNEESSRIPARRAQLARDSRSSSTSRARLPVCMCCHDETELSRASIETARYVAADGQSQLFSPRCVLRYLYRYLAVVIELAKTKYATACSTTHMCVKAKCQGYEFAIVARVLSSRTIHIPRRLISAYTSSLFRSATWRHEDVTRERESENS